MVITNFRLRNMWLGNGYHCHVEYKGVVYKTVDHAFYAIRCTTTKNHNWVAKPWFAHTARNRASRVKHKFRAPGADDRLMLKLLWSKFHHNPQLRKQLLATYPKELINASMTPEDLHWEVDRRTGEGNNQLGKLLMQLRLLIREGKDARIPSIGNTEKDRERIRRWRQRQTERLNDLNLGIVVRPMGKFPRDWYGRKGFRREGQPR